jgi:hypothetical protein
MIEPLAVVEVRHVFGDRRGRERIGTAEQPERDGGDHQDPGDRRRGAAQRSH